MMKAAIVFGVVLVLGLATNAWAQIPRTLSYQGVLTDSVGTPKPDGTYTFTFRLYDGAASEGKLVGSQQRTLPVKRGLFHTTFDQLFAGVSLDRPYWLSVQLEGEPELSPRIALSAVAYSLSSIHADTARYAVSAPSQPFVDSARIAGSIVNNSVTTPKLADGAVTMSKIDQAGASSGQVIGWNGIAWAPQASSGWSLTGNAGTSAGTHFMGTTDSNAFDIRTNNTVKVRITPKGGIETYNTGGSVYLGEYAGTNDDLQAHFLGNGNVFVGFGAGYSNTSGRWNTAAGHSAFNHNLTGAYNTANGHLALSASTSGNYNTAIGEGALLRTTVSSANTALGVYAGGYQDNGVANVFLGANTSAGGDGYSEAIAIGNGTVANGSNVARFGNSATSSYGGWADWSNVSDGRFKSNVQTDVPGLAFITRLRPITYNLAAMSLDAFLHKNLKKDALPDNSSTDAVHTKALQEKEVIRYSGFVAQEVEVTARELGYEFSGVDAPRSENDYYGLRYAQFVVPLVKAVQEQQKMIEAQQQMAEGQQRQIDELKAMVKSLSGAK